VKIRQKAEGRGQRAEGRRDERKKDMISV